MLTALAGRRIDDPNSDEPRFPLAQVDQVRIDLSNYFKTKQTTRLVCSGACGADLVAMEVAGEMGIDRTMILPFDLAAFREISVADRPGEWGRIFDEVTTALGAKSEIKILGFDRNDPQAFEKTNDEILAIAAAQVPNARAIIVWDGKKKEVDDATHHFRESAIEKQLPVDEVFVKIAYKKEYISRARLVLAAENKVNGLPKKKTSGELEKLYVKLEEWDQFSYAADVLQLKVEQDEIEKLKITSAKILKQQEQLAKYIYKDSSLPSSFKFDEALRRLNTYCDLKTTERCETLGLAGAVYKRKWQFDHQARNLELSCYYYKKGFESWRKYLGLEAGDEKTALKHCNDNGWTAINYAYVCEMMAMDQLEQLGPVVGLDGRMQSLFKEAKAVRWEILSSFMKEYKCKEADQLCDINKGPDKWSLATIAEAFFGLARYDSALKIIRKYLEEEKDSSISPDIEERVLSWKIRTFAEQLQSIAHLQSIENRWTRKFASGTWKEFLGEIPDEAALARKAECLSVLANPGYDPTSSSALSPQRGKTGLALSGGGFRASLYHIGVLAALAELEKLKEVEVISCVSGGSIIGAYYYLELKRQLEKVPDGKVDYLEIVSRIQKDFPRAIRKNLRMKLFSNPVKNGRMMLNKNYSRTNRLGELYQKHLYDKITQKDDKVVSHMNELFIRPYNMSSFSITTDNWKRTDKVPQLILNATSVNTGHNFQFTASWMGEPPGYIQPDIDVKPRLRRMYYEDAPPPYREFKLGYAVGASSCVPVMFEPLPMHDLYIDEKGSRIELQLIDGGLHDNQGIASLIDQECKNMIISDASGQMSTKLVETGNPLSVFFRADTILQERVREIQFMDLKEREKSMQVHGLSALHLKKGLQIEPWAWLGCEEPSRKIYSKVAGAAKTPMHREAQKLIAEIRTDLDSFNETEAYAIMYCGYIQTKSEFGAESEEPKRQWEFLDIVPFLTNPVKFEEIKNQLKVSAKIPFKVLRLSRGVQVFTGLTALIAITGLGLLIWRYWNSDIEFKTNVSYLIISLALFILGLFSEKLLFVLNPTGVILKKLSLLALTCGGFLPFWIYLAVFNKIYNRKGKL